MGRVAGLCVSESERAVGSGEVSGSESSQESATLLDRWFGVQPTSSTAKSSGSRDRWISANPTEGWWGGVGGGVSSPVMVSPFLLLPTRSLK